MKVVIVEPLKEPIVKDMELNLKSLQEICEGYIECISLSKLTIAFCNEEGKLIGLPGNRKIGNDIIAGNFAICGVDNEGEYRDLSDSEVEHWVDRFKEPEHYTTQNAEDAIRIEFYAEEKANDAYER